MFLTSWAGLDSLHPRIVFIIFGIWRHYLHSVSWQTSLLVFAKWKSCSESSAFGVGVHADCILQTTTMVSSILLLIAFGALLLGYQTSHALSLSSTSYSAKAAAALSQKSVLRETLSMTTTKRLPIRMPSQTPQVPYMVRFRSSLLLSSLLLLLGAERERESVRVRSKKFGLFVHS